jgi:hypothetical protein
MTLMLGHDEFDIEFVDYTVRAVYEPAELNILQTFY